MNKPEGYEEVQKIFNGFAQTLSAKIDEYIDLTVDAEFSDERMPLDVKSNLEYATTVSQVRETLKRRVRADLAIKWLTKSFEQK